MEAFSRISGFADGMRAALAAVCDGLVGVGRILVKLGGLQAERV